MTEGREPGLERAAPMDRHAAGATGDEDATGASAPEPRLVSRIQQATLSDPQEVALDLGDDETTGTEVSPGIAATLPSGDRVDASAATYGREEDRIGEVAKGDPPTSVGGSQDPVDDERPGDVPRR